MKKTISLFLALVVCLSLCACGKGSSAKKDTIDFDSFKVNTSISSIESRYGSVDSDGSFSSENEVFCGIEGTFNGHYTDLDKERLLCISFNTDNPDDYDVFFEHYSKLFGDSYIPYKGNYDQGVQWRFGDMYEDINKEVLYGMPNPPKWYCLTVTTGRYGTDVEYCVVYY